MTNWIKDGIDHEPMIEKIARAIFPKIKWAYKWAGDLQYNQLNDHAKNSLRGIAKAVLAVMVDPTLEMRKAARFEACEIDYPAMIAAAWQREEGNNGAPVGSAPPSDDGGSMAHNSSNPPSHSHSPSPVYGGEKLANEVIKRLQFAQIASCECETKTHEAKYHEPACLYRILSEAEIVARAYIELVENRGVSKSSSLNIPPEEGEQMNDRNEMTPEQALLITKHLLAHAAPRAQILIKAAALRVLVEMAERQAFVPCQNANRVCDQVPECDLMCATRAACLNRKEKK